MARRFGVTVCAIVFVLAALVLGAGFRRIMMPDFYAPSSHLLITAGLACAFALSALTWPRAKAFHE